MRLLPSILSVIGQPVYIEGICVFESQRLRLVIARNLVDEALVRKSDVALVQPMLPATLSSDFFGGGASHCGRYHPKLNRMKFGLVSDSVGQLIIYLAVDAV
jgi:hypothetical protein